MADKKWTKADVVALLESNPLALERALVALFRLQTEDERETASATHDNNRGFSGTTAVAGTRLARWICQGNPDNGVVRRLDGWTTYGGVVQPRREVGKKIALKHAAQLAKIANGGK